MAGNIVTKDEEKPEVLNTFSSVFNNKTDVPQDIWPPELVDEDREQNKFPINQEEADSDQLRHFNAHKSMGTDGIHPE